MKIGIIIKSTNINNYENIEFRKAALSNGYNLQFLFEDRLAAVFGKKTNVYYKGEELDFFDVVLPRTGSATTDRLATIIDAFEHLGSVVYNKGSKIRTLMDKFKTYELLSKNGIPCIKTAYIRNLDDLEIAKKEFNFPVVLKLNTSSLGYGIYKCENYETLKQMCDLAYTTDKKSYYLIQEFVDYKSGEDIRIVIVDGQVIGTMKRHAPEGEFITNFSQHNTASKFEIDDETNTLCLKIMDILNIRIAGIDLLETKEGFVVCEVNSSPGFRGLNQANPGLNTAKEILKIINNNLNS